MEVVWECQWSQIDTKMSEQLLCFNENMAKLSRQHNDANILVLGSRLISSEEAIKCFTMFFSSEFEGGRHQARLEKFNHVESIK